MINRLGSPLPSLSSLTYGVFKHISKHPLIVTPPIYHPLDGKRVFIERYRLFNGIELDQGLSCSIFPYYQQAAVLPEPRTINASAIYVPENMGNGTHDLGVYHIAVMFHYANNILGNKVEQENLIYVPSESVTHPDQILLTSLVDRKIELYINPASDIIGNYLELLRLVIEDQEYGQDLKREMNIKSMEMLYSNIRSIPWEKEKGIYFHTGEALIRFDSYVSRGWRDRFKVPVTEINIASDDRKPINNLGEERRC
jgi:hypothetical protein